MYQQNPNQMPAMRPQQSPQQQKPQMPQKTKFTVDDLKEIMGVFGESMRPPVRTTNYPEPSATYPTSLATGLRSDMYTDEPAYADPSVYNELMMRIASPPQVVFPKPMIQSAQPQPFVLPPRIFK